MDVDPPAEARPAEPTADAPDTATSPSSGGLAVRVPNRFRPEPIAPPPRWYGWQTLLADGAGVALLTSYAVLTGATNIASGPRFFGFFVPGALTLGLGTPILHAQHGAFDRAAASGLARLLGVPLLMLGTVIASGPKLDLDWPGSPRAASAPGGSGPSLAAPLVVGGIAAAGIVTLDAFFAWSAPPPPSPSTVRVGIR